MEAEVNQVANKEKDGDTQLMNVMKLMMRQ